VKRAIARVDSTMTSCIRWFRLLLLTACLAALGCEEKKPPPKVDRIGGGDAAAGQAAPKGLVAPPAGAGPQAAAPPAESPKRARKKAKENLDISDGEDLGTGKQRFAVLPKESPGGLAFEIAGDDVDRFAFVPGLPNVDSTMFLYTKGSGTGAAEGIGNVKDESQTEYELPDGFTPIESTGVSRSGMPWRIRSEEDGAVMAFVPEGVFIQGSNGIPGNNGGAPQTAPEHGVLLDAFYIDLREVTSVRYEKFREATNDKTRVRRPSRAAKDPQEPVLGVTWAEAHAFALWAKKDLPTEAQWEKAARGPDGYRSPWGNGPPIWHRLRIPGQIDKVASFRGDESPYGVFDMAGNAQEWCSDWYTEKYYSQLMAESGSTARNPIGPKNSGGSNMRVVKGGDPDWFVWARSGVVQNEHPNEVGFRCVLKLKPVSSKPAAKEKTKSGK
jgi:sulfatase modifying factor 1